MHPILAPHSFILAFLARLAPCPMIDLPLAPPLCLSSCLTPPAACSIPIQPGPLTTMFWELEHGQHGSWALAHLAIATLKAKGAAYGVPHWQAACDEALDASWQWSEDKIRRVCRDAAVLLKEFHMHAIPSVLISHVYCPNT